jgi:Sec-independent protein translocase protein TatA
MLLVISLVSPVVAGEKEFKRHMRDFQQELLLSARNQNQEKNEEQIRSFFEKILESLDNQDVSEEESKSLYPAYAIMLDTLRVSRVPYLHSIFRKALRQIPIPEPVIESLINSTDKELTKIRRDRARNTTPEGLLKHYGNGKLIEHNQELFKRERSTGYAPRSENGDIEKMLNRYNPRLVDEQKTQSVKLKKWNEKKMMDDIFRK